MLGLKTAKKIKKMRQAMDNRCRWIVFIVTFTTVNYLTVWRYYTKKFFRDILIGVVDIYHEFTTKYLYLRPSEIRFNSDYMTDIAWKTWDGSLATIYEELRDVLFKNQSVGTLSRKVLVVKRRDGRKFAENRALANPNKLPGWWVVKGNEMLWILQKLQQLKHVELTQFRVMSSISDNKWYSLCNVTKKSYGGKGIMFGTGSVEDKEELEEETKKILDELRDHLAPPCLRTHPLPIENLRLRLVDYETPTKPRNTASCSSGGVCHMTKREFDREKVHYISEEEMNESHVCQRPIKLGTKIETPKFQSTYDGLIDFTPFVWGFACLVFVGILGGCCLKQCGCLLGLPLGGLDEKSLVPGQKTAD